MVEKLKNKATVGKQYLKNKKGKLIRQPVLGALYEVFTGFQQLRVTSMAAESAYYIILAFFPFLIFIVGLLGFIGRQRALAESLLSEISGFAPGPLFNTIEAFLIETLESSNLTLLSFSMLGIIWASSNGFTALLRGLDRAYDEERTHSFFFLRGLGLVFTLLIGAGILLLLILVGFGGLLISQLREWMPPNIFDGSLLEILRFATSFAILFIVFTILYMIVAYKKQRFLQAVPGAFFSACGWIALTMAFSWYVNNFDRFARLYGSIAGLILLMVWIYLCCNILLLGGIINSVIHSRRLERREKRRQKKQSISQSA